MKLCKDCKHYISPAHPLSQMTGAPFYTLPMCSHPDAERSVVTGALVTTCEQARGVLQMMSNTARVICPNAKLFEQAPPPEPKPELQPYSILPEPPRKTWFARIFRANP